MHFDFANFLQQIINGLSIGAIYALIAVGYTMVYGVLRLINFAHGDIFMVGAMTGIYSSRWMHLSNDQPTWLGFLAVLLISMIVCAGLGLVIERVAYRPLRNHPRITALITAIGISMFLEAGGQFWIGATPQSFPVLIPGFEAHPTMFEFAGGATIGKVDVLIFGVTITLMIILRYIVQHTRTGMALRAVSHRFDTAALMGININRIVSVTFVLGSALAAAAGVLYAVKYPKVDPLTGLIPGIKAFIAAVLGGIGDIGGAVAGGFLLGLIEVMVVGYTSSNYKDGVAFAVLIAVLLIRPQGLFGQNAIEKV